MNPTAHQRLAALREVGDRAHDIATAKAATTPADYAALHDAEDRAHGTGIAWNDIDSARTAGLLDPHWTRIRATAALDAELRTCLPRAVHDRITLLREILTTQAALEHTDHSNIVLAEQIPVFDQHRRNLTAVHTDIAALARLLDPRAGYTHTVGTRLTADWEQAVTATVREHGTGPRLDELWWQHAEPEIEQRSQQLNTATTRRFAEVSSRPHLPNLEELTAHAERAAHTVLPVHTGTTRSAAPPALGPTVSADAIAAALPAGAGSESSIRAELGDTTPAEQRSTAADTEAQL